MLPLAPPLEPMLAKLSHEVPVGDFLYEPKWDGFRCLAFVEGDRVDLRSRNHKPLSRYFPEVVEALSALDARCVLDGELVILGEGTFDFGALLARLHPSASRVERLRRETPAVYVAFDLLAFDDRDLRARPFAERRGLLERLLSAPRGNVVISRTTPDPAEATSWLERFAGRGVDGIVAKARDLPYEVGKRSMIKVKRERTADCVVGGYRFQAEQPVLGSLLLGLWDGGELRHVGVSSTFTIQRRRELLEDVRPLRTQLRGHPWEHGFGIGRSPIGRLAGSAGRWDPTEMTLDWVPVRPELVCEVRYDQLDGARFRHPAKFVRWRPDRDPASCTFEQFAPPSAPIEEIIARP